MAYLPTFWLIFMANVGTYAVPGSYGSLITYTSTKIAPFSWCEAPSSNIRHGGVKEHDGSFSFIGPHHSNDSCSWMAEGGKVSVHRLV